MSSLSRLLNKASVARRKQPADDVPSIFEGHDVTFRVGSEGVPVGVRKSVLTGQSKVFLAMFEGGLKERGSEVVIPDIEYDVFIDMMEFLYHGKARLDRDNVFEVLYAAQKYELLPLISACTAFITQTLLKPDCACVVLEHAHMFDMADLHASALAVILERGNEVLSAHEQVKLLCRKCLRSIVTSGELQAQEVLVWSALTLWAKAQCSDHRLPATPTNMRQMLGDLIYSVRFLLIPPYCLTQHVTSSDILTDNEKVTLLEGAILEKLSYGPFSGYPRHNGTVGNGKFRSDPNDVLCFCVRLPFAVGAMPRSWVNYVTFRCTKAISLCGFVIFGARSYQWAALSVEAVVVDRGGRTVAEKCFRAIDGGRLVSVFLDGSVFMAPGREHTLCVRLTGPSTFSGDGGRSVVNCGGLVFKFQPLPSQEAMGTLRKWMARSATKGDATEPTSSLESGQIPQILFSVVPDVPEDGLSERL